MRLFFIFLFFFPLRLVAQNTIWSGEAGSLVWVQDSLQFMPDTTAIDSRFAIDLSPTIPANNVVPSCNGSSIRFIFPAAEFWINHEDNLLGITTTPTSCTAAELSVYPAHVRYRGEYWEVELPCTRMRAYPYTGVVSIQYLDLFGNNLGSTTFKP